MKIRERILVLLGLLSISFTSFAQVGSAPCPSPEFIKQPNHILRTGGILYLINVPDGIDVMTIQGGALELSILDDPFLLINWRSAGIDSNTIFYCSYSTVDFAQKSRPKGAITLKTLSRGWRADTSMPNGWKNLFECGSPGENRETCRAHTA